MIVRRVYRYWQFIAAIVLPVWLLVGWGVFGSSGWGLVGLILVTPVAFIALLVIALLITARKSVRETRAVSWLDIAVLTAWHLSIVGIGFYGASANWFGIGAIVLAIAAFWIVLWELLTETRARVASAFATIEHESRKQSPIDAHSAFAKDGDVFIVKEDGADSGGPAHA